MTAASPDIRRILVTLESSDTGRSALDIAARLAAMLHAELEGVFVEDINLISLAGLPFLREIKSSSLIEEAVSPERMQRDLKAQARQAERMLMQHAESIGVSCTFRVWRGHATLDTLSASFEADILSIARTPAYRRAVAATRPCAIERICVLYSSSAQAQNALTAACQLANSLEVPVNVLLSAGNTAQTHPEKKASAILAMSNQPIYFEYFDGIPALVDTLNTAPNTVLIVEAGHPLFKKAGFNHLLDALSLPVLIVR